MDIEKAKNRCNELVKVEHANWVGISNQEAVQALLNELDKDNNIISDLQNEVTLKQCELDKKDKRLKRQFKILQKRDKQIEEIKQIAHNDFEERCRLTFEIEELENKLDNKDKIINAMTEQLAGLTIWNNKKEEPLILMDKQEVIDYFTKKVEGK